MSTELGAGAWSYFGDPRAISHAGHWPHQPRDRERRARLPLLHLGRRDARPRGPADRLLSRRTGALHQVEASFTSADGRTWRSRQLTAEPDHYCIRPVTPRGLRDASLVLFSRGDRSTKGFTDFHTRIHFLAGAAPPV